MLGHRDARAPGSLPLRGAKSAVMRLGGGNPAPSPLVCASVGQASPPSIHGGMGGSAGVRSHSSRHHHSTRGPANTAHRRSLDHIAADTSAARSRAASTPSADAGSGSPAPLPAAGAQGRVAAAEVVSITPLLQPRRDPAAVAAHGPDTVRQHGSRSPDTPPQLSGAAPAGVGGRSGGSRPASLALPQPRSLHNGGVTDAGSGARDGGARASNHHAPPSSACWGEESATGGDSGTVPQPPRQGKHHHKQRSGKHQRAGGGGR